MKPDIAAQWVEALRSDKYKQGMHCLKRATAAGFEYCCLGVLTELYQAAHADNPLTELDTPTNSVIHIVSGSGCRHIASLPDEVRDWAGLSSVDGSFGSESLTLASLNDNPRSFSEIAGIIEANVANL